MASKKFNLGLVSELLETLETVLSYPPKIIF